MPLLVLQCDPVNLSFDNKNTPICQDPLGQNAWMSIDAESFSNILVPLTYQEGFEIAGGVIALWSLCWVARMLIQTIRQTRYG